MSLEQDQQKNQFFQEMLNMVSELNRKKDQENLAAAERAVIDTLIDKLNKAYTAIVTALELSKEEEEELLKYIKKETADFNAGIKAVENTVNEKIPDPKEREEFYKQLSEQMQEPDLKGGFRQFVRRLIQRFASALFNIAKKLFFSTATQNDIPDATMEQPEAPKPEQEQPEAPKPEQEQPEAPKPEQEQPEAPKPEQEQPEAPKPEQEQPEAPKPEQEQPEAPKPEQQQLETPNPEQQQLEAPKPEQQLEAPKPEQQLEAPKPEQQLEAPKPEQQLEAPKPEQQQLEAPKPEQQQQLETPKPEQEQPEEPKQQAEDRPTSPIPPPPPPPPSPADTAEASPRDGLLDAIKAGKKLNKASDRPVSDKPSDERDDLLGAIRAGKKLNDATKRKLRDKQPAAAPQDQSANLQQALGKVAEKIAVGSGKAMEQEQSLDELYEQTFEMLKKKKLLEANTAIAIIKDSGKAISTKTENSIREIEENIDHLEGYAFSDLDEMSDKEKNDLIKKLETHIESLNSLLEQEINPSLKAVQAEQQQAKEKAQAKTEAIKQHKETLKEFEDTLDKAKEKLAQIKGAGKTVPTEDYIETVTKHMQNPKGDVSSLDENKIKNQIALLKSSTEHLQAYIKKDLNPVLQEIEAEAQKATQPEMQKAQEEQAKVEASKQTEVNSPTQDSQGIPIPPQPPAAPKISQQDAAKQAEKSVDTAESLEGKADLLNQIRKGKPLNKVDTSKPDPRQTAVVSNTTDSFIAGLQKQRGAVYDEEDDLDNDGPEPNWD